VKFTLDYLFIKPSTNIEDSDDDDPDPVELVWIGSSRKALRAFPPTVRREFGVSLFAVPLGETPPSAKALKGFRGAGVLEPVEDNGGDTYRAVYTVRFTDKVYVPHVFQTKSKTGIATSRTGTDLIWQRLKLAEVRAVGSASGNVFADLDLPDSERELVKAKLTVRIYRLLKASGLTQTESARLLGTTQAQISALMRCKPVSVSVGRPMEFLTTFGQDIQIAISPASGQDVGRMSVVVKG
jgi:phage-related protein/predicted XRE-type DNA-binding protein